MTYKPFNLVVSSLIFLFVLQASGQEVTSENGPRLKEFLDRFPKSDLNKNGVLTLDEMHDYLDKKIKDGATSEKREKAQKMKVKGSLKNLTSRVYLSLFLKESPDTDLDKNGVLTKEELLNFIKLQKLVAIDQAQADPAPAN